MQKIQQADWMIIVVSFLIMKFMCCFPKPNSIYISMSNSHDLPKIPEVFKNKSIN